jgi:hypothetical protein
MQGSRRQNRGIKIQKRLEGAIGVMTKAKRSRCFDLNASSTPQNHIPAPLSMLDNREGEKLKRGRSTTPWRRNRYPAGPETRVTALVFKDDIPVFFPVSPYRYRHHHVISQTAKTYSACMMPGIYPRIVRRILMSKSAWHPRSRKTPRGGRMIATPKNQPDLQSVAKLHTANYLQNITTTTHRQPSKPPPKPQKTDSPRRKSHDSNPHVRVRICVFGENPAREII